MLNQTKSAKWARLKLLFVIPLTGLMLCLSTTAFTKDYGTIQLGQKKESLSITLQDTTRKKVKQIKLVPPPPPLPPNAAKAKKTPPKVEVVRFPPPVIKKDGKRLPPPVVVKDEKLAPPPLEPRPAKSGNASQTITGIAVISDNNTQSVTSTSPATQNELKSITVTGYPSTVNKNAVPVKKVKGIKIDEVTVVGYPSKKQ